MQARNHSHVCTHSPATARPVQDCTGQSTKKENPDREHQHQQTLLSGGTPAPAQPKPYKKKTPHTPKPAATTTGVALLKPLLQCTQSSALLLVQCCSCLCSHLLLGHDLSLQGEQAAAAAAVQVSRLQEDPATMLMNTASLTAILPSHLATCHGCNTCYNTITTQFKSHTWMLGGTTS